MTHRPVTIAISGAALAAAVAALSRGAACWCETMQVHGCPDHRRYVALDRRGGVVAAGALRSRCTSSLSVRPEALVVVLIHACCIVQSGPAGSSGGDKAKKDDDYVDWLVEQVTSRLGDISVGTGLGFCSGYALKQVGKAAAVTVGALFVLVQVASAKGYIDVNWKKVEKDVITAVDPDGDGKITKKDLKIWFDRLLVTLKYNLPSSAGFSAGFVLGITC